MATKARLQFENFVVPEFYARKIVDQEGLEDTFELIPRAVINRQAKQFHVTMSLQLIDVLNDICIDMVGIGIFTFNVLEEDELLNYMALNGPAIVFPYLRSFIATYTANSGFDTITIPTLNLAGFKQDIIENILDLDNESPIVQ